MKAHADLAPIGEPSPAPLGRRVGAWAIDAVITILLPFVLYLLVAAAFSDDIPLGIAIPVVLVLLLFHLLYAPLILQRAGRHAGQTVGKRALGLRVLGPGGERVHLGRALARELVARSLLGLVPLYTIVDLALPFANRERRAVHDLVAATRVVTAE